MTDLRQPELAHDHGLVGQLELGAPGIVLDRRGTSDQAAPGDPKIEWLRFLNSTMKKDLMAADQFAHRLGLDLPMLAYTSQHTAETIGLPDDLQTNRY